MDFTAPFKKKSHIEPLGIDDNDAQKNTCLVPTNISSANYSMTFTESRFCVGAYTLLLPIGTLPPVNMSEISKGI